jgi:hypothetical protein
VCASLAESAARARKAVDVEWGNAVLHGGRARSWEGILRPDLDPSVDAAAASSRFRADRRTAEAVGLWSGIQESSLLILVLRISDQPVVPQRCELPDLVGEVRRRWSGQSSGLRGVFIERNVMCLEEWREREAFTASGIESAIEK